MHNRYNLKITKLFSGAYPEHLEPSMVRPPPRWFPARNPETPSDTLEISSCECQLIMRKPKRTKGDPIKIGMR